MAEKLLRHALQLTTTGRIKRYLVDQLAGVVPDFEQFDTS
jgi:hypothetical protein